MEPQKLVWHIEQRKVTDLIPYSRNPRKMSADMVERLRKSI
jgi:hypothetical protein